jgi:uncharacterized protein (DUF302 family)
MQYGYTKEVSKSFDETIAAAKAALAKAGFGVLFELDIANTLKQKIGAELERYMLLGACNPTLAYRAIQAEREIGLLLPCNVLIYQKGGKTFVSTTVPTAAMSMVENAAVQTVAEEAESLLKAAIDTL